MSLRRFLRPRPAIFLHEDDTVMEAINRMIEAKAGAVAIVDDEGSLKGVFTERDVMVRVTAEGLIPDAVPLRDVMTTNVVKVSEDLELNDAINIMSKHRIRHLPVLDRNDKIIGMISARYLLHERITDLVNEIRSLEAYIDDAPGR